MRKVIRVDGTEADLPSSAIGSMRKIEEIIGAPQSLDTVNLRHLGKPLIVMIVDDTGMVDGRPVNQKATALYWKNCRPGMLHPICGDVVICPDDDFAMPDGGRHSP